METLPLMWFQKYESGIPLTENLLALLQGNKNVAKMISDILDNQQ